MGAGICLHGRVALFLQEGVGQVSRRENRPRTTLSLLDLSFGKNFNVLKIFGVAINHQDFTVRLITEDIVSHFENQLIPKGII